MRMCIYVVDVCVSVCVCVYMLICVCIYACLVCAFLLRVPTVGYEVAYVCAKVLFEIVILPVP